MKTEKVSKIKAVLTGDVIQAEHRPVSDRQGLPTLLEEALEACELPAVQETAGLLGVQFFQEGRFQIVLDRPEAALPAALHMIAWLRHSTANWEHPVHARVAVGVGRLAYLDGKVNLFDKSSRRLFRGGGKAFLQSNRMLKLMSTGDRRLGVRTDWYDFNAELHVACLFLDHHIKRWTADQAESILALVQGQTQKETALNLNISQSAVAQRSRRAGGKPTRALLKRYERYVKNKLKG